MNASGMDRTMGSASSLVLSAADSFDEDVNYDAGESDNLQYSWTCKECVCVYMYLFV